MLVWHTEINWKPSHDTFTIGKEKLYFSKCRYLTNKLISDYTGRVRVAPRYQNAYVIRKNLLEVFYSIYNYIYKETHKCEKGLWPCVTQQVLTRRCALSRARVNSYVHLFIILFIKFLTLSKVASLTVANQRGKVVLYKRIRNRNAKKPHHAPSVLST